MESVFGVLKKQWSILTCPLQFDMTVQAKVHPALAALHNFIMKHDPNDIEQYLTRNNDDDLDPNSGQPQANEFGDLADGAVTQREKLWAKAARDQIAESMWRDYQAVLENRE